MKRLIFSLLSLLALSASGATYNLSLPAGASLIANHLNAPGGNTLNNLLPNPPPGTTFYKWNCTAWTAYVFDDIDLVWYPDGLATLNPGEGALIDVPVPTTITFTGTPVVPVLPVTLPCGCNQTNLLSRQTTNAPSTFQDVTGFAPADGTTLTRISGGVSAVYTFSGGVWSPGAPLLNQGEADFIRVPCPTNTVAQKWLQIPDTSMNGLDVKATTPKTLADDFLCTATGPITQVRIWGSWRFDAIPPLAFGPCFNLGIWTDIPTNINQGIPYSRPGQQLCNFAFPPGSYTGLVYTNGVQEQFFDPNIPAIIGFDTMIWEYVFDLTNYPPCWQTNGNIYWLSVQADCFDTNNFLFGWKTCPTNWNDDAVFGDSPFFGAPPPFWMELRRPPYYTNSLDLSFEIITSQTNQPPPPTNHVGQKWLQVPDASTNGIDVQLHDWSMLADDFRCTATGPITEVRIWGSWLNDVVWTNPCFCLGLWTDIPVSPTNPYPYSLPGQLLCETCFYPGQFTSSLYTNVYWEQFWDPWNPILGQTDSQVWEYVFTLPTNSCWLQTNGNTYWLSLRIPQGCFDPFQYQFGWKTCPTNWNDDAVYGYSPGYGWQELRRPPYYTNSLDLAFEIITSSTNQPPPPTNTIAQKWLQIPDTSMNGLDVKATDPKILADDFLCTATGPITQVRIWTSWLFDLLPPQPPCFSLGIWTDIPTNINNPYSRPGMQICSWQFLPGTYTNFLYTNNVFEQFFDPNIPAIIGSDTMIWEYVFDLTNFPPCWQTNGNIYWLSVQADCFDTNNFLFGWKTCPTNWNDAAVFGDSPFFGAPPPFWMELRRPPYYTNSLDLAFEIITSQTNQPPPPTNNIGQKWLQIPDTTPNGIDVHINDWSMLADDFRCTATGPITEVRIWGSWLNDVVWTNPCFCIGLWTDIPVSPTNPNPYSLPGQLLCETCFYPGQYTNSLYTNVYWEQFWDPWNPISGLTDSQVWEYVFSIPTNSCWWQTNGNTYWLSVRIPPGCFDPFQYQFGWKTCPTNWNDDAVYGYSPGSNWQELRRPPYYTNSLDLAFEIITGQTNPCPPGVSITCGPDQVFECGTNWTVAPPIVTSPCCGTNYTLTYSTVTNGTCPWVITYTWQVVDCAGYAATCTHTVTIVDTTKPVLTCAPNKTVQCTDSWSFDPPTAYDICCGTNLTIAIVNTATSGICPQIITRQWQATDCCSNFTVCAQSVTVTDTNPPVILCPSNILVWTCSTNVPVFWTNTAMDLCSSVTVTSSPPSGTLFNRDTTNLVTATATDACSNSTSCTFQVVIRRPSLTISIGGSPAVITVAWPDGGILQYATNLTSPITWTDLPLATSPYTVSPSAAQMFYRLRCP